MRRYISLLLALSMLLVPCLGRAESAYTGHVIAGFEEVISAPYGGRISQVMVQEGMLIPKDTLLAQLETEKTYSPVEGQITAVFAEAGNSGETVKSQYGAVVWIEPTHRYTIKCSVSNQQKSVDNQWVSIGEKVFLRNTSNRQREGTGVVTALSSKEGEEGVFYVEVDSGEFIWGETVSVHREADYNKESSIGSGKVQRNAPVSVNAEGMIALIHVKVGEYVNTGDLLFETVTGTAPQIDLREIKNVSTGIVAELWKHSGDTVEQGETIATIYPMDQLQVEIQLSEACLSDVQVGDSASIVFNWMAGSDKRYPATVSAISYLSTDNQDNGSVTYAVVLDFDADDTVRVGMTATVYLGLEEQEDILDSQTIQQQE